MIESNQNKESEPEWFTRLQAEISAVRKENLEQFRAMVDPDTMGFNGKEGVDDGE